MARKYLKYALGEILLVMIGILLALRVNNWNERRKQKRAERAYMEKFSVEVDQMLSFYEETVNGDPLYIQESSDVMRYLQGCVENKEKNLLLDEVLKAHQTLPSLLKIGSTYEEMVATGAIAKLENDSLKNAINQLYASFDRTSEIMPYFREDLGRASNIIWDYVEFRLGENEEFEVKYDFDRLCKSTKFRNAFLEIIDSRRDHKQMAVMVYHYLQKVDKQIDLYMMD